MILFYASRTDSAALRISKELNNRNVDTTWVAPSDFVQASNFVYNACSKKHRGFISVCNDSREIDLSEISVVCIRRPSNITLDKKVGDLDLGLWMNNEYKNLIREVLEIQDCPVFPGPLSRLYGLENDKFRELIIAAKLGLDIPETIVTNNPREALEFYRLHNGRVISKRYRTSVINFEKKEYGYPTSPVSIRDIGFIQHIRQSPTLFQEYIPKEKELRVTIIGKRTIAAEIDSQKTHHTRHDWRNYDWKRTPYSLHILPDHIHEKLVSLTKTLGLNYATSDLVITPAGEYKFLEINPAGQYEWVEKLIGFDITGLICDELVALSEGHKAKKTNVAGGKR